MGSLTDSIILSTTSFADSATVVLEALLLLAAVVAIGATIANRSRDRRRPRVVLGSFEDGPGAKGFGAAVLQDLQAAVMRLQGAAPVRPELVTAASGDISLPAASITALPHGTTISGLLSLLDVLYPSRDLKLDGCLLPDDGGGVGIWLRISNRRQSVTSVVSLRRDAYAPKPTQIAAPAQAAALPQGQSQPSPSQQQPAQQPPAQQPPAGKPPADSYELYAPLVTPAAVWLTYHIWDDLPGLDDLSPCEAEYPFGVKRWESYSLFAAGAESQEENHPSFARALYHNALAVDPHNRMALLNLAVLDIRLGAAIGDLATLERACRRLARVRQTRPTGSDRADG